GVALLATPNVVRAHNAGRRLTFHNLHTEERLSATYWIDGRYDKGALSDINHLLRDHRTGDVFAMDPKLMDLLHTLGQQLGVDSRFEIISGYRSPKTNSMLAAKSGGV